MLDNVDFSLCCGEIMVLFGENGVGKLMLIKVLIGVYYVDCGIIWLEGQVILLKNIVYV